jgi:hypothetical protein
VVNELILLFTLHCLADYPLQGDFLANMKGNNYFLLLVHAFIWSGMVWAGFNFIGVKDPEWFIFLFGGHVGIDHWKCNRPDKSKALTTDLYIDQLGHAIQIITVYFLAARLK